ncbi:MAG: glycogen operon protein GlgX [Nitrospirae bacterium]|nr:MAG: glycogen operon protein GlgX [Nitrospirota bacterium]
MTADPTAGKTFPLGPRLTPDGVNFSLYSDKSSTVELLFFDNADAAKPARVITLDPRKNRTHHYWHIFVPSIGSGQIYGYRIFGPHAPARGLHFDHEKVLLDPYARGIAIPVRYDRSAAYRPGDNTPVAMKSVVADLSAYDWEGDVPLRRPFAKTIIYEMHVGGFTKSPNSGVAPEKRGTFAGLVEKIPYLRDLGITAIELLPTYQFDPQDAPPGLLNYWGYSPISFFTPHRQYSSRQDLLGPLDEFRDMVKALHRAGIEVILDVVYNHTAEGDLNGPTFCYRGLANDTYYILEQDNAGYTNFSGCGNTLNANHAVVRRLILDSLRFWVSEMHVDGFRFDLASILSRDEDGNPLQNPPVVLSIDSDPVLAGTKLIAEAWDAAGLYQVGSFVGEFWQEWNGRFRDDVRSFFRGDSGTVPRIASRFFGSPDMYGHEERGPEQSINFVTCHDGFTLNDNVSYNQKHNEANRENNRDGCDANLSWNCGVEGPSDDPAVEGLRVRQIKNFLAATLLSVGTPMLLMGDEMRRTQLGNNNAYCHDSELNWMDWSLLDKHADIHRFVKLLIAQRQESDTARIDLGFSLNELIRHAEVQWHGVRLNRPDWSDHSHSIAFSVRSLMRSFTFHCMMNAYWEPLDFELPRNEAGTGWQRVMDTSLPSPDDIVPSGTATFIAGYAYTVQPRSVVMLFSRVREAPEPRHKKGRGPASPFFVASFFRFRFFKEASRPAGCLPLHRVFCRYGLP